MLKSGDLVRWTSDGIIFIRRVKSVGTDVVYYFDKNDIDACIDIEKVDDALLHVGESVKILDTGEVKTVSDVFPDGFRTKGGAAYDYENYDGYLTFNVIDGLKDDDDEVIVLDEKLNKIVDDCCSVLDSAAYSYERRYVEKMVSVWWNEKQALIEKLRRHPDWDENSFSIKGKIKEIRESKEQDEYLTALKTLYRNCRANGMRLSDAQLDIMWDCVQCTDPEINISKETVDKFVSWKIESTCGFVPHVGEKYSRVLNKIFKSMGLDQYENYNRDFAVVSDAINPVDKKQNCVLSVHPCDYLKMSWGEKWKSCHDIRDRGCYHAGTQSYMMDRVSMVFYTIKNSGDTEEPWRENKLTRQIFAYDEGVLLQSRCYPNYELPERNNSYLDFVLGLVKLCGEYDPNEDWVIHQSSTRLDYIKTVSGSTHYPDYIYDQYNTRVLVYPNTDRVLNIGHLSINLLNGVSHSNHENINSKSGDTRNPNQTSYYICEECGYVFHQGSGNEYDGYDGEGRYYCEDHYRYCDKCGQAVFGEEAMESGYWVGDDWYCEDCQSRLIRCDRCGEYFDPDYEDYGSDEEGDYCESCAQDAVICECCGRYLWSGDDYEYDDNAGEYYCRSCWDDNFTVCEECEAVIRQDKAHHYEDICMCENCFTRHTRVPLPEESASDSESDNSNKYEIVRPELRLINPTTAFSRFGAENFALSVITGEIGELVDKYSNDDIFVLKMSETNKYVAIMKSGVRKIGG